MTTETETQRIGKRLAALRHSHKISQRALADKAGVSPTLVVNIENGHGSPKVETLAKILAAMGYKLGIIPID